MGIGSNVGDRAAHLASARAAMASTPGWVLVRSSAVHETEPVGVAEQPPFLNQVVELRTNAEPREVLDRLLQIEATRGRRRSAERRWGPRTLDLDLLLFGDRVIDEPGLRVPHPRLAARAFVLAPLCELAAELIPPGEARCVRDMLEALQLAGVRP